MFGPSRRGNTSPLIRKVEQRYKPPSCRARESRERVDCRKAVSFENVQASKGFLLFSSPRGEVRNVLYLI